jgi:Tfp pilus assembly protein PilF
MIRQFLILIVLGCAVFSGCTHGRLAQNDRLRLDSRFESQLSMARLSERHGDVQQAQAIYQAVIAKQRNNQLAHHRLAVLAAQNRQVAQADYHFHEALAAGPAGSELLNDMGYHMYLQHRLDKAETQFRQSLIQDPTNQAAHNNLGLVLGEQGRIDEAFHEFQLAGSEAGAHANLAYVYALSGDLDRAEQAYHHALAMDEKLKPAAEALLQLATRPRPPRPNEAATMTASYNSPGARQPTPEPTLANAQHPTPGLSRVTPGQVQLVTDAEAAQQTLPPSVLLLGPPLGNRVAVAKPQPAPAVVLPIEHRTSDFAQQAANAESSSSVGPRAPSEITPSLPEQPHADQARGQQPAVDYTTRLADRRSVFTPPQTDNAQQQPWTWQPPFAAAQGPAASGQ